MKLLKGIGILLGVLTLVGAGLYLSGYGGTLAWQAFVVYNEPSADFDPLDAVAAPDYSNSANWAARPDQVDLADLVPLGIDAPEQAQQPVDTFFIHPTGFLNSSSWTSPMNPQSATEENTLWMMANQASAYNGCCNVYAPRYREATIMSYFGTEEDREEVLKFAYQDVKRAFEYYLENYNQGRPFIIASHSQGTHHAVRLLSDVIDTGELHERMVAAYLIGSVIIPVPNSWFESMNHISPCQSADDLHCVVHWDTMPEGALPIERTDDSLCTNPLSWRVNEERADESLNEGAVVPEGSFNVAIGRGDDAPTRPVFEALGEPLPAHTWAQCKEGSLFVRNQDGTGFEKMGSGNMGSYHGLDYALFYMNIRNNAKLRSNQFFDDQIGNKGG